MARGGQRQPEVVAAAGSPQSAMVDEIKRQLQSEMGLLPVRLLRERRESFVELNAYDNFGKTSYGTAGYLGDGYFITVKHGVIALDEPVEGREARRITSIKIRYKGKDLPPASSTPATRTSKCTPATGRSSTSRPAIDLPPLRIDTSYAYDFAEPIFRLGNDYSKGIILSTGYVGQRTSNGLVTCLTDGHPGCLGRRRAEPAGRSRRHSDRPDAGRLSLLVHPAAARRDVPQGPGHRLAAAEQAAAGD